MEVAKKIANQAGLELVAPEAGRHGRFFDLQECTAHHFKDMIHICLEPEAQGSSCKTPNEIRLAI